MTQPIVIDTSNTEIKYEYFIFNGGEVSVKLVNTPTLYNNEICLTANIKNSQDFMLLLFLTDALRIEYPKAKIILDMPYLPYARQDRVCDRGESFSLKVFTNIINSMDYEKVYIHDCHSDVGVALLDRVTNVKQVDLLSDTMAENILSSGHYTLLCPDSGARKKCLEITKKYKVDVVYAEKVRDPSTGNILKTEILNPDTVKDKRFLIVDDICDGGMTFIKIAEELYRLEAKTVALYVTHGIFSKGLKCLFDAGINPVLSSNTF